ncbi:ribosomal-processing cysteine protease Prp [Acetobacterium sp.]|uniref:ribosomal-processing cysteine protease Prp n=1 Tax=Acetobacterium sp. TaxID=1872094 RepID=UPI002F42DE3D
MISVKFFMRNNEINEITVSGHAGFANEGEDIICAAVSVLTISVLNGLTEIVGRKDLCETIKDGYTNFIIPKSSNELESIKTDTLIATYQLGIQGIKEAYGDYIQIKEEKK